jgi:hypothetical protein
MYFYINSEGGIWFYFTFMTFDLIAFYYSVAMIVSIIGVFHDYKCSQNIPGYNSDWSLTMEWWSHLLFIVFTVCAATSFFITVIEFLLLSPALTFNNISEHLITSITFIIELSMNSIEVRPELIIFNISWAFLYLLFIWPVVFTGAAPFWPYDFLKTDTSWCFFWYTILVIANIIFFIILWLLYKLKHFILQKMCHIPDMERIASVQMNEIS